MCKNSFSLILGVVLGAILGILICDEKKKKILKVLKDKSKALCDHYTSTCQTTLHEDKD